MSITNLSEENILPDEPVTPHAEKEKYDKVCSAIMNSDYYQSGQTPSLRGLTKDLFQVSSTSEMQQISGVPIDITPKGVHVFEQKAGEGATSEIHKVARIDKETGLVKVYAKLETRYQAVYERAEKLCNYIKNTYQDEANNVLSYLNLPKEVDRNEQGKITALHLVYHQTNLLEANPSHRPLYYYAKELLAPAKGLSYLHRINAIHSDIKADNILASDGNNSSQLADFGFTIIEPKPMRKIGGLSSLFAPEVYNSIDDMKNNKGTINPKTDIYMWGLMMRELMINTILPAYIDDNDINFSSLKHDNIDPHDRDRYGRIFYIKPADKFTGFAKDEEYKRIFNHIVSKSTIEDQKKKALNEFMNYSFLCTHNDPQVRPTADAIAEFLADFALRTEGLSMGRKLDFDIDDTDSDDNNEFQLDAEGYLDIDSYSFTESS